jgi:oligopeptide/dipeptide ABC transporter ATP-binding protein
MVEVTGLKKYFRTDKTAFWGRRGLLKAVDDISFSIQEGRTLGIVGESGSGKTTAARSIVRLIEPDAGQIKVAGTRIDSLKPGELRIFRKNMQMVFQDPQSSLNPNMTLRNLLAEPLIIHLKLKNKEVHEQVNQLLLLVGMEPGQSGSYPREFSGGQQQRIGIARAIALNPKFVILDEPVSSLDVSIQGQVLNLLKDLQERLNLTYLFIAHDISVVDFISDRIVVMYLGRIVEENSKGGLYKNPLHPYTQSLISSIPGRKFEKNGFKTLPGEIPSPENTPEGCFFHPRCQHAKAICRKEYPSMKSSGEDRVACFLY